MRALGTFLRIAAVPAVLLLVATLFVGWRLFGIEALPRTYHYRLTLYVETPEGLRQGSSVIEVRNEFPAGPGYSRSHFLTGEATVVDLGARGLLFALLVGDEKRRRYYAAATAEYIVESAFPLNSIFPENPDAPRWTYIDELNRRKPIVELTPDKLPLLARFIDPANQNSIQYVDPLNLAASFGPGVKLTGARLTITDDAVTSGLVDKLPWLKKSDLNEAVYRLPHASHLASDVPQVQSLGFYDFRRQGQ